jgi:hypothetical protein
VCRADAVRKYTDEPSQSSNDSRKQKHLDTDQRKLVHCVLRRTTREAFSNQKYGKEAGMLT